jgi:hypothetical protein
MPHQFDRGDLLNEYDQTPTEPAYAPEVEPVTPVPVIVVNRANRELRTSRSYHVFVSPGDAGRMIINRHDTRTSLRVTNLTGGTSPVYVGSDQSQGTPMHGYLIKLNEWTTNTQTAVYAGAGASNPGDAELCVYEEFTVPVP